MAISIRFLLALSAERRYDSGVMISRGSSVRFGGRFFVPTVQAGTSWTHAAEKG